MDPIILVEIFALFLLAKLAGELFERMRQPPVIGELLVGVIIANTVIFDLLRLKDNMEFFELLAELGVMVLLFTVGLETRFSDLSKVGRTSLWVATLGVVVPFGLGFVLVLAISGAFAEAMFVGAAMVATSVGITARVLSDLKMTDTAVARVVLGAAVIDDVMGMMVLTVVSAMAGGTFSLADTAVTLALAVGFVLAAMLLGGRIIRTLTGTSSKEVYGVKIPLAGKDRLSALRQRNAPFVFALIICFGLSALANYLGLAAIIGAFVAGMAFAEVREKYALREKMDPVNDLLVPFFFVNIGLMVSLADFTPVLGLAVVVTILAVVGKLVGCGLAALPMGRGPALVVGVGMVPRGEVGIIVAMVGLSLNTIPSSMFTVVVFMSIATTMMAPPMLVWAVNRCRIPKSPPPTGDGRKVPASHRPRRKKVAELVGTEAGRRK